MISAATMARRSAGGECGSARAIIFFGAVGFERHQGLETLVVNPRPQVRRRVAEPLQVFQRQVNASAVVQIDGHVPDDVGQLEGQAQVNGVLRVSASR